MNDGLDNARNVPFQFAVNPGNGEAFLAYLDGHREGASTTTVEVPVDEKVKTAAARWIVTVDDSNEVELGRPCVWDDSVGLFSPDGRYLAVFLLGDGASAEIHLVDLGSSPVDTGAVPRSKSSNYSPRGRATAACGSPPMRTARMPARSLDTTPTRRSRWR